MTLKEAEKWLHFWGDVNVNNTHMFTSPTMGDWYGLHLDEKLWFYSYEDNVKRKER